MKIIGRAHTVLFRRVSIAPKIKNFAGHYVSRLSPSHNADLQIDSVTPGSILFLSGPSDIPNAIYGGLMSARARTLGAVGTIVDGRIRDLDEHRQLNYPVFSRDFGITAGQEVCYSSEIGIAVPLRSSIQPDVWINHGDIIIADEDGIACIPQALEEEVAKIVSNLVHRDKKSMEDLLAGESAGDVFNKHRGT